MSDENVGGLVELPEPARAAADYAFGRDYYTAKQMHAYATACVEAAISAHGQPVVDVQAVVALIGKPLRKIVSVDRHADSIYGYQRVVLECGHEVSCSSRAFSKARCRHCQKNYREALTAALGAAP